MAKPLNIGTSTEDIALEMRDSLKFLAEALANTSYTNNPMTTGTVHGLANILDLLHGQAAAIFEIESTPEHVTRTAKSAAEGLGDLIEAAIDGAPDGDLSALSEVEALIKAKVRAMRLRAA